ncbi:MAG TPA: hypothetical protein VN226_06945 [Anaerolineales bacterium]|nr:hypothetical protein [Anaerolineales bacterium]
MFILLTIHSILRWVIVIFSVLAIYFLARELSSSEPVSKKARIMAISFAHLMTMQVFLGLAFLYQWYEMFGSFTRQQWEHTGIMVIAAIVANIPQLRKNLSPVAYKKTALYSTIAALVLVIAGVASLGLIRWLHVHGIF